jgi:hypothetical protein
MPLLVNMSVGSLPGTRPLEGTTVWPLEAKKSRNDLRMSATENVGVGLTWFIGRYFNGLAGKLRAKIF